MAQRSEQITDHATGQASREPAPGLAGKLEGFEAIAYRMQNCSEAIGRVCSLVYGPTPVDSRVEPKDPEPSSLPSLLNLLNRRAEQLERAVRYLETGK